MVLVLCFALLLLVLVLEFKIKIKKTFVCFVLIGWNGFLEEKRRKKRFRVCMVGAVLYNAVTGRHR